MVFDSFFHKMGRLLASSHKVVFDNVIFCLLAAVQSDVWTVCFFRRWFLDFSVDSQVFYHFSTRFFNGWIFVGFTLAGKNLLFVHPFYEGNLMFKLSAFIVAFSWVLVSTARFLCEWSACRFVCLNCLILYQVSTLFFVTTAWYLSVCMFAYLLFVDRLICFCWKYLCLSNGFGRKYFWLFYSAFWNNKTTAYFLNCNLITV